MEYNALSLPPIKMNNEIKNITGNKNIMGMCCCCMMMDIASREVTA
jgi:hypothetical protein